VAEGCLAGADGGDRAAVGLQVAGCQQGRVGLIVAVAGSAGQEGNDRLVAEVPQIVALPVPPLVRRLRDVVDALELQGGERLALLSYRSRAAA
jgi:hypothetical protein